MKKRSLTAFLLSLILILALLMSSCIPNLTPPTGDVGGNQGGTQGGNQGGGGNDSGNTPGGSENTPGGSENTPGGSENDPNDSNDDYVPPVIVNPPAPEFGGEDDEAFGEYSVYYLFDTRADRFTLRQIQSNEKGEIRAATMEGELTEENGHYTLHYDSGEIGYGKRINGVFYLTDESFACPEDHTERGGDGITEVAITPSLGGTDYGYRDLSNLKNGRAMQSFYREMLAACKEFATSKENLTNTADYYKICELDFTKHGLNSDDAQTVWSLLRMENPIFYWLSSVCYYTPTRFYLSADEEYATYASRATYDADIQAMLDEASALLTPAMNDVERALVLHNYLLSIMDYAYIPGTETPETAVWAHNITGAATMGKGVCETYAKTYQLLMQKNNIPTLYVTGYAGELHAWNLVYLCGEWVGVDATWNDMGEGAYLTSHFGLSASALAKDHTQDPTGGSGTSYHYQTPAVSPLGLCLVTLSKNGSDPTIYGNIDDALAAATDTQADYILSFYNYTEHGAYNVAAPSIYYYSTATVLPEVRSLRIEGEFYTSAAPYAAKLHLLAPTLTVNIPLTLEGIHLAEGHCTHRGVMLGETLTLDGALCELTLSYLGRASAEDEAVVKTNAELTVNADLNLSELTFLGESPVLTLNGGEMHIEALTLSADDTLLLHLHPQSTALHLYRECAAHLNLILTGDDDAHLDATTLLHLTPESKALSFTVFTNRERAYIDRSDFFRLTEQDTVVLRTLTELNGMIYADGILLSYRGTNATLTLPESIDAIGACAFADYLGNEIILPEGILHLLRGALEHSSLEYITLPASLCTFDTSLSDYTVLAPVKEYTFLGSYADWARVVAVSDLVLYYYTTPATVTCSDGAALTSNPIQKQGENLPLRAVSGVLRDIVSTGGIQGKRMHLIDYNESGEAVLITYDVYSSGAYGVPATVASLTMTVLGEGRYSFTHKGTTYYITVANGTFTYTNQSGEPISSYPV